MWSPGRMLGQPLFYDISFIFSGLFYAFSSLFVLSKSAGEAKTKFELIYCIDSTSMCRVLAFLL